MSSELINVTFGPIRSITFDVHGPGFQHLCEPILKSLLYDPAQLRWGGGKEGIGRRGGLGPRGGRESAAVSDRGSTWRSRLLVHLASSSGALDWRGRGEFMVWNYQGSGKLMSNRLLINAF